MEAFFVSLRCGNDFKLRLEDLSLYIIYIVAQMNNLSNNEIIIDFNKVFYCKLEKECEIYSECVI